MPWQQHGQHRRQGGGASRRHRGPRPQRPCAPLQWAPTVCVQEPHQPGCSPVHKGRTVPRGAGLRVPATRPSSQLRPVVMTELTALDAAETGTPASSPLPVAGRAASREGHVPALGTAQGQFGRMAGASGFSHPWVTVAGETGEKGKFGSHTLATQWGWGRRASQAETLAQRPGESRPLQPGRPRLLPPAPHTLCEGCLKTDVTSHPA